MIGALSVVEKGLVPGKRLSAAKNDEKALVNGKRSSLAEADEHVGNPKDTQTRTYLGTMLTCWTSGRIRRHW